METGEIIVLFNQGTKVLHYIQILAKILHILFVGVKFAQILFSRETRNVYKKHLEKINISAEMQHIVSI
jgi:hypothetical protein